MRKRMRIKWWLLSGVSMVVAVNGMLAIAPPARAGSGTEPFEMKAFLKGVIHTHTARSFDGEVTPQYSADWYQNHGYDFVAFSDHSVAFLDEDTKALINPATLERGPHGFTIIPGVEVSYYSRTDNAGQKAQVSVHVGGICLRERMKTSEFVEFDTTHAAYEDALSWVNAQPGAVAQINHPNDQGVLGLDELELARQASLMEIANMHPLTRNGATPGRPDTEGLWDLILTQGIRIWGTASDDAHGFLPKSPRWARPGTGWVQVAADANRSDALCKALSEGRFYASIGVVLTAISWDGRTLTVENPQNGAKTVFTGAGSKLLSTVRGKVATYHVTGGEGYVRAKVTSADGKTFAWTQPVFVD